MCCRYYYEDFERDLRELMRALEVVRLPEPVSGEKTRRDVYPSQAGVVIHGNSGRGSAVEASEMYWGFSNPVNKSLIINARAETARERKTFADSIERRRCVVPASGFYEWDTHKSKFRFTSPDGGLLLFAGFYREEKGVPRYTILTTAANESMIRIHDRMPVMIGRDEIIPWIEDSERLQEFLSREQFPLMSERESGQISFVFDE